MVQSALRMVRTGFEAAFARFAVLAGLAVTLAFLATAARLPVTAGFLAEGLRALGFWGRAFISTGSFRTLQLRAVELSAVRWWP
jgi:hypothetical protein